MFDASVDLQELIDTKRELIDVKGLLRYVAYLRLPLGDTVFDHLDFDRQKKLHDILES